MADDMADKLKAMLDNPEMMSMLSSFLNQGKSDTVQSNDQIDSIANIKSIMDKVTSGDDKKINLLNALRPYMRNSRASSIDKAVKMLKITQLGSILKDL